MSSEFDRIPASLRAAIVSRAKGLCEYCRCPEEFSPDSFTLDHVKPRQAGGESSAENLALSCSGCNGRKYTRTQYRDPETGQIVALFNPRQQQWSEHFNWDESGTLMTAKTACGRATIMALALNRAGVVNLRRLLVQAKLHPPG